MRSWAFASGLETLEMMAAREGRETVFSKGFTSAMALGRSSLVWHASSSGLDFTIGNRDRKIDLTFGRRFDWYQLTTSNAWPFSSYSDQIKTPMQRFPSSIGE